MMLSIFRRKGEGIHHHHLEDDNNNNNDKNYSSKFEYILMYVYAGWGLLLFVLLMVGGGFASVAI
jgi:hypothetical protein